jgi:hypothetical protein
MRKILNENQDKFNLKISPEFTSKKGFKYKKLYVFGNTYDLYQQLKGVGKTMKKEYGATWDGKAWYFPVYQNKSTGEYDVQNVKNRKVRPYIEKINEFYNYTLDFDKLIDELENYTPGEQSNNPNAPQVATKEETDEIRKRLERFKEKLLNISSSEELQNLMRLITDVKKAKKASYDFSPRNKIAIKTQRPDATIVASRKNWRNWYNRDIKPDAKPIFVSAPQKKGFSSDIQNDYLKKVGKSRYNQLTGVEKSELYNLQGKRQKNYTSGDLFDWVANYDVKDTIQIPGTYDELSTELEKAEKAAAELGGRDLTGIDSDTQTTTDEKVIKPVYNGLLGYADAQNIKASINIPKNITAGSTKLLASALLSQILSGQLKGIASKASAEAKTPSARRQRAEVASWQFMDAFGVKYNLGDVDMNTIFGSPEPGKTPEEQKQLQKKQINNVLKDIAQAVNHLIDFVNINIKDNANLSEIEGKIPQGKHITINDIAKTLNIPSDMLATINENNIMKLTTLFKEILNEAINKK